MGALIGGGESHKSNIAKLGEDYDPTSWITKGIGADFLNPHKYIRPATDKMNEWLGTVTKPINKLNTQIEPGANLLNRTSVGQQWNQTIENRPIDAIAMVMAAIFGGGALAGAGGASAGAAGAPAASGGAGAMGGLGGMSGASAAITPTFASGVGAGSSAISGAGFSGLGTLGASGTAAANSMLPQLGQFASMGGSGISGGGFLGNMSTMDKIDYAKKIGDALQSMGQNMQKQQGYTNTNSPIGSYHNYHLPRSS